MVPSTRVSQILNHLHPSVLLSRSFSTSASTKHSFLKATPALVEGTSMSTFSYPQARRQDLIQDLHGVKVADPYRWLEDPKSEETQAFIASQNTLCEDYIGRFPHTKEYRESLTKTYNYERYGAPARRGDRWYYSYNEGLKAQSVHYTIENDRIDGKDRGTVFFDPNTLSEDGTLSIFRGRVAYRWSGADYSSLYSYALSQSGSDWCHARIRNVATGEDYPDKLEWIKFSGLSFSSDNKGLFYQRYPEPVGVKDAGTETGKNGNAMAPPYYILVHLDPENPTYYYNAYVTFDGDWLRLSTSESTDPVNKLWLAKLDNKGLPAKGKLEWIKIKDDFDSGVDYIANNGNVFYLESNLNAPKGKVVRYDLDKPEDGFVTILPEQPHAVLERANLTNEKYLCLLYQHNVQHKVLVVPLESLENEAGISSTTTQNGYGSANGIVHANGSIKSSPNGSPAPFAVDESWLGLENAQQLDLPLGCTINGFTCRRDETRIFFSCVGYTLAGRIYKYTFNTDYTANKSSHLPNGTWGHRSTKAFGSLSIWRESVVDGFEPDRWAIEQVWVPNPNDRVKIPMYVVRDKSLTKTGDALCLLYGYGGFNYSVTPNFSPSTANLLTHSGGIYCVANIRGGGEFGEQWHKAAVREKRPVAFSDFEECGRYLIREGWTRKEKLVCQGASNGGALIGAVMNRAGEEIFAAGIAQVGVLDLLRYHLFTIGYAWKPDFGDPDVKEDFDFIYKWSPYHNIRDGKGYQYPAILCETSDHDDRVVPLHSFKYVAALQHAAGKTNRAPLLLRHHLKAGHGAGKPTQKIIEEASERFAFMMTATGTKFRPRDTSHKL